MNSQMTTEAAVRHMQRTTSYRQLVEAAYLDLDADAARARFLASVEFAHTLVLIEQTVEQPLGSMRVLDLGAGTGMAAEAFLARGAALVLAVEPEIGDIIGLGRLDRLHDGESVVNGLAATAESMPVQDGSVDVVYCRQVLHHLYDLDGALRECARVLRPGGLFLATREHVVDDAKQLERFLAEHPVHQLAGGEHAWSLDTYRHAVVSAGLVMRSELAPWDTVINAYPDVTTDDELRRGPEVVLARRMGPMVGRLGGLPGVRELLWRRLRRAKPGRLYTFVAVKPTGPQDRT